MVSPLILSRNGIETTTIEPVRVRAIDGTVHEVHETATLTWTKDNINVVKCVFYVASAAAPFDLVFGSDYLLSRGVVIIDSTKMTW